MAHASRRRRSAAAFCPRRSTVRIATIVKSTLHCADDDRLQQRGVGSRSERFEDFRGVVHEHVDAGDLLEDRQREPDHQGERGVRGGTVPAWRILLAREQRRCSSSSRCAVRRTGARRMAWASPILPLLESQRGLSGMIRSVEHEQQCGDRLRSRTSSASPWRCSTPASPSPAIAVVHEVDQEDADDDGELVEGDQPCRGSLAGAISAMYRGESIEAMPTPTPPMIRAMLNSVSVLGMADQMAETVKSTADRRRMPSSCRSDR